MESDFVHSIKTVIVCWLIMAEAEVIEFLRAEQSRGPVGRVQWPKEVAREIRKVETK